MGDTQTVSPASLILERMSTIVGRENMTNVLEKQEDILTKLRQSNRNLEAFNNFSAGRYEQCAANVESYTAMLKEMKADLESVFRRVRALKVKVAATHSDLYHEVTKDEPEEDDD
ncbi:KxDL motif-containing protein 1 [Irineochytrium annulatum]|nr:KxDL motif-containing protein 1 [Irineochytrium annulatum]